MAAVGRPRCGEGHGSYGIGSVYGADLQRAGCGRSDEGAGEATRAIWGNARCAGREDDKLCWTARGWAGAARFDVAAGGEPCGAESDRSEPGSSGAGLSLAEGRLGGAASGERFLEFARSEERR